MGLQFRKSVKIAPGVRINFGKKSTSVSFGPRGAKITTGTNGTHVSAGIPGTGLYYIEKVSGKRKGKNNKQSSQIQDYQMQSETPLRTKGENNLYGIIFVIIALVCFIGAIGASLEPIGRVIIGGAGAFSTLLAVMFLTAKGSDETEKEANKNRLIKNHVCFTLGILIIIGCIVFYIWSTGWEWTGHSKTNIYIKYDFSWIKYIFYPILIIVGVVGVKFAQMGLSDE